MTRARRAPEPDMVERPGIGSVGLRSLDIGLPAEHIATAKEWRDVVLPPKSRDQIRTIENWVKDHAVVMNERGIGTRPTAGYWVLFHGPAGTGKTLTATLLGKSTDRPVVRIDLSRLVSRYIGETEKNLSRLLDEAGEKGWILFFDEADALFGKRTEVHDAHDRYANQEVAYLLGAIESHPGLVILATTHREDIARAVLRRVNASVQFSPHRCQTGSRDARRELGID